jgi:hypothetical protein
LNFIDRLPKKNPQKSNIMKIRSAGAEFFHADGQTDMKLIVATRNFRARLKLFKSFERKFKTKPRRNINAVCSGSQADGTNFYISRSTELRNSAALIASIQGNDVTVRHITLRVIAAFDIVVMGQEDGGVSGLILVLW